MPHINRIRVNNVKYNFGTQSYDDFVMRLSGKNTIYDLANGGGKSVLMLLLLQNMIPNCTLDEKQPIEKLFRSGNDNKVIHSLIEWKLTPCHVRNGFVYMTTGFCARKAKEEAEEERRGNTAPIEYFNYCIFYREFNANDIVNLPLQNGDEKVTYQGLKNYLRELGKKDYSLEVHIFDGKGEYQRFISRYGIYESEWELIRGINKTEGHVRTFFETHYKTTRKVVEDLFIEEIIEKSYKTKWEDDDGQNIARTLLDIKDKLVELARKKGEIEHFDHQAEALTAFSDRLHSMKGIYGEKAGYEEQLVKTYRSVVARQAKMKADFEEDTRKLAEFNHKLNEIEKEIEQGKIAVEEVYLQNLLEETNNLKAQCRQMEEDAKTRENHLLLCEAANSYFEYVENEKQMKIQSNAIFDITGKNSDLLEELHALAYHLTRIEEAKLSGEGERYKEIESDYNRCVAAVEELIKTETEELTNLAVAQNQLEINEKSAKALGEQLEEMRQRTNLSLVEEVFNVLSAKENQLQQVKSQETDLRKQERSLIEMIARMETRKSQSDEKFRLLEDRRNECKSRLEQLEESQEKIRKMQEVYGETGEALFACVEDAYRTRTKKLEDLKEKEKNLQLRKLKLTDPENAGFSEDNQDEKNAISCALSYIKRHYDESAQSGEKYLLSLPKQEQAAVFAAVPFIGGCIVMNKNLQEAAFDEALALRLPENESVVLLSAAEINSDEINLGGNKMLVVANMPAGLLEEDKRQELIRKIDDELKENEKQINLTKESLEVLLEDLFLLEKGLHNDAAEADKLRQEYAKVNEESGQLLDEIDSFTQNFNTQKEALYKCSEKLAENEGICSKLREEIKLYREIRDCYEKYAKLDNEISAQKGEISAGKKCCGEISGNLKKAQRETEEIKTKLDISGKKMDLHKEAIARYAVYKNNRQYPEISVDKEELEQIFGGKVLALEEKNADISDKRRMVELYRSAMEKSAADIKYRNFTVEELAEFAKAGSISVMSMEELAAEKDKLHRAKDRLEDISKENAHKQSQFDRQMGTVEHGKTSYREKFGEDYVNRKEGQPILQLQKFVSEGNARLKLAKAEGNVLREQLRSKEKEIMSLESLSAQLSQLIENYEINMEAYLGELPVEADLTAECKKVRDDYQRLSKQEQKCRESFERDKAQLMETLNLLEAKDLAEEIQKQLTNPANVREVEQYIENINETISCIRLEKSRIGQSIEHMELMKENFVKQCLQTCVSIKEGLERLPKLSNIQLDNQTISMIQLQIPYIDESQYTQAMDDYISDIVESVDIMETPAERLKYIRSRLAWKRMFSVLVKDMDKIKLQLYKRERMKEQSRYLKYEEAVGSTGQSQGIYIQFLVAVINYISSMNSNQSQGELLKKVIFIDNPFGAAKDVYIWEPIFAMLKSNHVQLIVPARGVTPAITGRFEVNYILGQKLVGNRQQTVVVDYRSQVEEEALEYKELEYIQNTFDFT